MKKYEELELNVISFTSGEVVASQQQQQQQQGDQIQVSGEHPPKWK